MRRLLITSVLAAMLILLPSWAFAAERWYAVAGSVDIPLDDIECFVSTDGEYTMNIVLANGMVLSKVPSVSFAVREYSGVDEVISDSSDILIINNIVRITRANGHDVAAVVDLGGRIIASAPVIGGECDIDISDIATGMYILSLGNKSIKFSKR